MSSCALSATSSSEGGQKKCVPCNSLDTSTLLSREVAEKRLQQEAKDLGLWKLQETPVPMLTCQFTAKNFQAAMDALNDMGVIAERENHHPNFHLTNYRDVQIDVYTHKLSGITENDFTLAAMLTKEVKVDFSPKWLKEHPEAESSSKLK